MGKRNNNGNKSKGVESGAIATTNRRQAATYSDDEGNVIVGPSADSHTDDSTRAPIPEIELDVVAGTTTSAATFVEGVADTAAAATAAAATAADESTAAATDALEEIILDVISGSGAAAATAAAAAAIETTGTPAATEATEATEATDPVGHMDVVLVPVSESHRRIGICASIRNAFRAACRACSHCCFCCCGSRRGSRGGSRSGGSVSDADATTDTASASI